MGDRTMLIIIGAIAALLQLLIAPALTFGDATPSFLVVAVVVIAMLAPDERHYAFAFVLGIIADLFAQAPVGSTAFCLILCTFLLPGVVEAIGSENPLMAFGISFVAMFGIELVFSVFLAVSGIIGFGDAFVHVVLPCSVYNAILAFAFCLIGNRLIGGRGHGNQASGATMSNLRFN